MSSASTDRESQNDERNDRGSENDIHNISGTQVDELLIEIQGPLEMLLRAIF